MASHPITDHCAAISVGIVEGEALSIQRQLCDSVDCPLLSDITARIARDEARHVAFGRLYLDRRLAALPIAERVDIFRWVRATWWDCARAIFGRWSWGGALAGIDLDERWAGQIASMRDIGLIADHEADVFAAA